MGNPRVSYQQVNKNNYERLFITGLHFDEGDLFSKWFGEDFQIPTVEEWRETYNRLMTSQYGLTAPPNMSYPAKKIWGKMTKFSNSPIKFSLMQDGVIEWVRNGDNPVGLGAPRPILLQNTYDPLRDVIKPLKIDKRLNYFGLRLIKRGRHG